MTAPASGLFLYPIGLALGGQGGLDMNNPTAMHIALFNDGMPGASLDEDYGYGYSPWYGHEVTGGGYTEGGTFLYDCGYAVEGHRLVYRASNVTWDGVTVNNAAGALLYNADAVYNGRAWVNFGASYSAAGGVFTITWRPSGVFSINLNF